MPAHLLLSSETIREDLVMDVTRVTQHERTDLPTELEVACGLDSSVQRSLSGAQSKGNIISD